MGINKNVKIDSEDILRKRNTLPDIAQRRNAIMDTISGANEKLDVDKIFSERNLTLPSIPANHRQDFAGSDEGAKALTSGGNADNAYSSESQLNDWMNLYENQKGLSDGINGDAIYEQFKDMYNPQGKMAMEDTMGSIASALTGGYGNSYAASAGYQAYQSYLQNPELYQMAYDLYGSGNSVGSLGGGTSTADIPSDIKTKAASFKSNTALENYINGLEASGALTTPQADALYAMYVDDNEKYKVNDDKTETISFSDMVGSSQGWTVISNGGINWGGGIDNNAIVEAPNGEQIRLDNLVHKLVAEGMTIAEARAIVGKLQGNLII